MKSKIFSYLIIVLSLSSCAWLDLNPDDNYVVSQSRHQEQKMESSVVRRQYMNAEKNRVLTDFGKPKIVKKEPYPYLADPNCHGSHCDQKWADEIWIYEFRSKDSSGTYFYSMMFYFVNNKVVEVY